MIQRDLHTDRVFAHATSRAMAGCWVRWVVVVVFFQVGVIRTAPCYLIETKTLFGTDSEIFYLGSSPNGAFKANKEEDKANKEEDKHNFRVQSRAAHGASFL